MEWKRLAPVSKSKTDNKNCLARLVPTYSDGFTKYYIKNTARK